MNLTVNHILIITEGGQITQICATDQEAVSVTVIDYPNTGDPNEIVKDYPIDAITEEKIREAVEEAEND